MASINTTISTVADLVRVLGVEDIRDLAARSEVFDHDGAFGADVTAFVTRLPDGRWAAWNDFDGEAGAVEICDDREEAIAVLNLNNKEYTIEVDRSGVGHCWEFVPEHELGEDEREIIAAEIIDGKREEGSEKIGGVNYRWRRV